MVLWQKSNSDFKIIRSPPHFYSLKCSPFNYRQRICRYWLAEWLAWYCFKSETDWALKKNSVNYVYHGGRSSQTFLGCCAKEDGSWVRPWMIQVIRVCLPWLIILIIGYSQRRRKRRKKLKKKQHRGPGSDVLVRLTGNSLCLVIQNCEILLDISINVEMFILLINIFKFIFWFFFSKKYIVPVKWLCDAS